MKTVPEHMTDVWTSGDFLGTNAPAMRVTIQPMKINTTRVGQQLWASYLFGQGERPREISNNVASVEWERTIDSDVATCTVKISNSRPTPPPSAGAPVSDLFDQPGYYTWRHGQTGNRWGQTPNWWKDVIVPDRIMRTYEGYGWTPELPPEQDPLQVPSGVWIIDDVELDTDGTITITARDAAALLLDHIMFPPVVPLKKYPLKFVKKHEVANKRVVNASTNSGGGWFHPNYDDDSGRVWLGGHNKPIYGHYPSQAFDGQNGTYWLSIGNGQPGADYAFEWVQGKFSSRSIYAVKAKVWGGPYRAYLSVYADGQWKGPHTIPYNPQSPVAAPNGSDIRFVDHDTADREDWVTFDGLNYDNVTKVRITLTDLTNSGLGPFPYRGGIRDIQVAEGGETWTSAPDPATHIVGNYDDFTDIVKVLCAYGGFYWPNDQKGFILETFPSTVKQVVRPSHDDDEVGKGRVWGDFQNAGTWGQSDLGPDIFDKRPLMDGISYIRDITNFIFHVDETGGIVWRPANIWSIGNYRNGTHIEGTDHMVTIDENTTLLQLSAILSSRNVRERVFVASSDGKYGAVVKGHNPYPSGQRRVAGWSDTHFGKDPSQPNLDPNDQCRIMADLITLRQLFAYQTNRIVISGYPKIQIDDQIQIYEQVTSDSLIHYVKGVASSWDRESGKWTYTIDTHWLGRTPFTDWAFDPDTMLSQATKNMLEALGLIS